MHRLDSIKKEYGIKVSKGETTKKDSEVQAYLSRLSTYEEKIEFLNSNKAS